MAKAPQSVIEKPTKHQAVATAQSGTQSAKAMCALARKKAGEPQKKPGPHLGRKGHLKAQSLFGVKQARESWVLDLFCAQQQCLNDR